jgi:ubiquinone/menaquinone biosynthesis C-methylase UbiE
MMLHPLFPLRLIRWRIAATEVARAAFNADTVGPWVPRGSRLLDVGSWDARTAALLRDERGCDVLAVDVVDKNVTDVPFATFDGLTLPADDGSRDVVTLLYVLHHAADDLALLREARRVIAAGGRVLVAEDLVETLPQRLVTVGFHVWLWLWTWMGWAGRFRRVEDWSARFAEAGLVVAERKDLGPHLGRTLWPRNVLFVLEADAP